jgi:hypothetical protein
MLVFLGDYFYEVGRFLLNSTTSHNGLIVTMCVAGAAGIAFLRCNPR